MNSLVAEIRILKEKAKKLEKHMTDSNICRHCGNWNHLPDDLRGEAKKLREGIEKLMKHVGGT